MRELTYVWLSVMILALCVLASGCRNNPTVCDLDGNGNDGTSADGKVFKAAFGASKGDANWNRLADLDGDGIVTGADFAAWLEKCRG